MPDAIMRAMVALSFAWGWIDIGMLVMVGFLGLLRPGELLALRVADFILPSTTMSAIRRLHIRIGAPKMRRLAARREHVTIDDEEVIQLVEKMCKDKDRNQRIFPGSAAQFRVLWNQLCGALHISHVDQVGMTPASLRAGGATFWFQLRDNSEWVRFRGRWASTRMLEIYIQEAGVDQIMQDLAPDVRAHIARLANAAPHIVHDVIRTL